MEYVICMKRDRRSDRRVTRVVKRGREREREARFHHKIRRKVCSGCERRRSGRRARFSPSAQGMFPWINTIFAYPTVRRDIRRRRPISGARSRKRPGLLSGREEVRAEEGRKSASYAIIVGRVPSARFSCDVTRRPYCAPSWTRSVIAIKKCDSHTWRRSRGFDRGVRKTGARRGERRLVKEEREGGCAKIRAAADHARSLPATVAGWLRCARASVLRYTHQDCL